MFARAERHIAVDDNFYLTFLRLALYPGGADENVAEFDGAVMLAPYFDPVVPVDDSFNRL